MSTRTGYIDKIGDYTVEKLPIPRQNNLPIRMMHPTGVMLLHSTEGLPKWTQVSLDAYKAARRRGVAERQANKLLVYRFDDWTLQEEINAFEGAKRSLAATHYAPQFTVGAFRIAQHRQIGQQGAALRGAHNGRAYLQVEISANTEGRAGLWLPTDGSLYPLVALLAFVHLECGIPLRVPNNWPDDMSDCPLPWAVMTNSRRRSQVWEREQGVFMHLEVDDNNHFDLAYCRRSHILEMARRVVAGMTLTDAISSVRSGTVVRPVEKQHVVQAGDSFYGIARKYGCEVAELVHANGLTRESLIVPGQVLHLPE